MSDGAILVTTALDPDLHAEPRRLHVPAVVIDQAGVPDLDVPTIGATNWAASDQVALDVHEAVRTRGLRVPQDTSVVGVDDLPQAGWSSPPLTTVRQPLEEMGAPAVRTVLRLLDGEQLESPKVELATEVVVRASTAAPR